MEKMKIKELSENEELYLPTSFPIPPRFAEKLKWSSEYCVKVTLDVEQARLIVTLSDLKVKDNLEPILKNEDFYIIQEYENGKRFAELAKELDSKWFQVRLQYNYACFELEQYLKGNVELDLPKGFIIPEHIVERSKEAPKRVKPKKTFTQRHAIAIEEWTAGKTYKEIGEVLGIQPMSAKSLLETASVYLRSYLNGSIELLMPEEFVITEEIKETLEKEANK